MSTKRWYLKSGSKQVGPMTSGRVRARIAEGKLPARTRAWREGMDEWDFVKDVPEFAEDYDEAHGVDADDGAGTKVLPRQKTESSHSVPTREMPKATVANMKKTSPTRPVAPRNKGKAAAAVAPAPARKRSAVAEAKSGGGLRGALFPDVLPLRFEQPFRIEATDLSRGIGLGMAGPRIKLLTIAMFVTAVIALAPGVAMALHPILGVLAALVIGPVCYATVQIAMGALSYQTRVQIETGRTPTVGEAFSFAKSKGVALALTPILLALAMLVPAIGLAVLNAINFIPTVGPIFNGLIFGVHVVLAAAIFFLFLAYCLSYTFGPVIVAFEETGIGGTIQVLFDLVRRSMARFVLWSWRPALAYGAFSLAVILAAAVVIAAPLGLNIMTGGSALMSQLGDLGMGGLGGDFDPSRMSPEDFGMTPEEYEETFGVAPGGGGAAAPEAAEAAEGGDSGIGVILAMIPTALWVCFFGAIVVALLGSASNGIVCMFYLAGRRGNDDLMSRDAYLSLQQRDATEEA